MIAVICKVTQIGMTVQHLCNLQVARVFFFSFLPFTYISIGSDNDVSDNVLHGIE